MNHEQAPITPDFKRYVVEYDNSILSRNPPFFQTTFNSLNWLNLSTCAHTLSGIAYTNIFLSRSKSSIALK